MRFGIHRLFATRKSPTARPKTPRRRLLVEALEERRLLSVSQAVLNSWFLSGQGEYTQVISAVSGGTTSGPSTTWSGQTTAVLGDVQKVSYSTSGNYVYVNTPDLASYTMGPWWMDSTHTTPFVNFPKNQSAIYRIALNTTYPSTTHGTVGGGPVGLAVNGVVFYNNGDAFSYKHSTGGDVAMTGDGIWNRQAEYAESATFDVGDGHQPGNGQYHYHTDPQALRAQLNDNIDYVGDVNYFPYDPMAYYLTHGESQAGENYQPHTTNLHHSPIIGWMFDGYPIYGPYGYSNATDPTSAVTRMRTSFSLRTDLTTGSARISVPGWSAVLDSAKLGATAAATAANAFYTMTAAQQTLYAGPTVSSTYPLGRYGEDYAYVPGSGDLDQYGGRWCVTPEFPNGTYAYFDPIDANGNTVFPYILGRQYYGTNNGSGSTTISESVTVAFDVSGNTAPTVSGPTTASVAHGGAYAFSSSVFSVADVDAAATEKVTLTASAGTLNVNLTGTLASLTSITAGANNSSTITLSGNVVCLNAALATLTFTASSSGATATLSVQANDLSASNNLSSTLTNTISLSNVAPTMTGPATASVDYGATYAFSGNVFSVTDSDATSETVTLSVTSGALSATAGAATVTGNGSATMTIAGSLANVNAALATLVFSPPTFGATATLSIQDDDGSATNNLSNIVTTTISLNTNVATPTVSSVTPFVGPTTGGNTVVVVGTGFVINGNTIVVTGTGGVKFAAVNATSYTVNSATQITAVAPAGSSTVHVTVTNVRAVSTATTADSYTYAVPTVASVTINGGDVVARDKSGKTPAISGQDSVVAQILVEFNEHVRLDADAFNVTSLASNVTALGSVPSAAGASVTATPVEGTGNATDGYVKYVLTFAGSAVNSFNYGSAFTTLKDGLYSLNMIGARVHAGVSDTAADRTDTFWSLFGASNAIDVRVTSSLGGGDDTLLVDGLALNDVYNTFGSSSGGTTPTYVPAFDWNLDGNVDGVDLSNLYLSFGTIWRF